jgi:hypothetical protein
MKDYTMEEALPSERVERIARIFRNNGNPKDIRHLEWQYNNPPAGEAVTTFCVSPDNQDAAVYSVFPVSFRSSKHGYLKGSQSLDTLTDSRHRGKGAFVACAKSNYNAAIGHGIDFVYGFPNQFSAPGFFKKLGWSSVGYPPFRVFFVIFYTLLRVSSVSGFDYRIFFRRGFWPINSGRFVIKSRLRLRVPWILSRLLTRICGLASPTDFLWRWIGVRLT